MSERYPDLDPDDALMAAPEDEFIEAWTEVVGQRPACLLGRDAMISVLRDLEGEEAVERAADVVADHGAVPLPLLLHVPHPVRA